MPKKGLKLKRTQISLSVEDIEALRKKAASCHVSMSKLIRAAIRRELEIEKTVDDRMLSIIGIGEGSDPSGSETHDDVIYR